MWTTNPWSTTKGLFFSWEDSCERSLLASNEKCQWTKFHPLHRLFSLVRFSAGKFSNRQGAFIRHGLSFLGDLMTECVLQGIRYSILISTLTYTLTNYPECLYPRITFPQGMLNRMRAQGQRTYSTVCERNYNRRAKRACLLPILLFE